MATLQDYGTEGRPFPKVPNYFVQTIITTILAFVPFIIVVVCFLNLYPFQRILAWATVVSLVLSLFLAGIGIFPFVFGSQVKGRVERGDMEGARLASERARSWAVTQYWLGVIFFTAVLALSLLLVARM